MTLPERIQWLKDCTERERREYYQAVIRGGCAACGAPYQPEGPNRTSVHHCTGHGFPAKREHRPVIGLCFEKCHQYGPDAVHRSKSRFEAKYGSQEELLEKVERRLDNYGPAKVL